MKARTTVSLIGAFLFASVSWGQQPLLEEYFNYTAAAQLKTVGWKAEQNAGTNIPFVGSSGLTYAGYAGSGFGKCVGPLSVSGEDVSKSFNGSGITSGSVYVAFLVNVNSVPNTTGDVFLGTWNNGAIRARVWAKGDGLGGLKFSITKTSSGTPTYTASSYSVGTTYLLTLKYVFNTGSTTDDQVYLFVNPTIGAAEPSATLGPITDSGNDVNSTGVAPFSNVLIVQQTNTPAIQVSAIRVATDWSTAVAPGYTWNGGTGGDFTIASNWTPNRTSPGIYDVLLFNSGGSVSPINLPSQSIGSLILENSTTLAFDASTLTLSGWLTLSSGTLDNSTNNLTLGSGATIVKGTGGVSVSPTFGGTVSLVYSGTSSATPGVEFPSSKVLDNLYVINSNGLTLNGNTSVNFRLQMANNIALNTYTLTLGTAGTSLATIGNLGYISGFMTGAGTFKRWYQTTTVTSTSGYGLFPFGSGSNNRNAIVFAPVAPTAGGTVSVSYTDANTVSTPFAPSFVDGTYTFVNRYDANWAISVGDGLTGTSFSLALNGSAIPGITAITDVTVSSATGAAPGTFSATSGTTSAPIVNRTALTQATLPSTYYIASTSSSPLPVQIASLSGTATRTGAYLAWTTTTETNCYGFDIERRLITSSQQTAAIWSKVGFVEGAGTSSAANTYSFSDGNVSPGRYAYRLKQIDKDGTLTFFGNAEVEVGLAPKQLSLGNYPNPFNPTTNIEFTLAEKGHAVLRVFNVLGQEVASPFNGEAEAGRLYTAKFDAAGLSSGLYFYTLESGNGRIVRKMTLMK